VLRLGIGGKEGIFEVGKVGVYLIGVMTLEWSSVEREPVEFNKHTRKINSGEIY